MAIFNASNNSFQSGNKTLFEVSIPNNTSLYSAPWDIQVARGQVANVSSLSISGYQGSVGGTWIPLWDGGATTYTYLGAAVQLTVWSSSASDTAVPVTINGLDTNYNLLSETITLTNGVTGVVTTNSFLRVNNITSSANPVGNISVGNSGKTVILAVIPAGNSRSSATLYTVPNSYTFYLTQVTAYTTQNNNQYANYRSYTRSSTGLITTVLQFPLTTSYLSRKVAARPYTQKTDIQWQFTSSGTSQIGAQIEGYLIAN